MPRINVRLDHGERLLFVGEKAPQESDAMCGPPSAERLTRKKFPLDSFSPPSSGGLSSPGEEAVINTASPSRRDGSRIAQAGVRREADDALGLRVGCGPAVPEGRAILYRTHR